MYVSVFMSCIMYMCIYVYVMSACIYVMYSVHLWSGHDEKRWGVVMHHIQKEDAGVSPWVQSQPGLHNETLFSN